MKTSRKGVGPALFLAILLGRAVLEAQAVGDSLDQLAWMAGSWAGEHEGIRAEEHWIAPEGGLMLGLHRDVAGGKAVFFEFLRIEKRPDGIVYLASPRGVPATPFRLVESKGKRAVFENKTHDFPKRILYWLSEDGSLHARIEGAPGEEKKARVGLAPRSGRGSIGRSRKTSAPPDENRKARDQKENLPPTPRKTTRSSR